MKLYNHELESFTTFLFKLNLIGKASRMRTRFIKILTEKHKQFKEEHFQLIKEYAHLDSEGNPIIIESEGKSRYDIKDQANLDKEYYEIATEEIIIDESDSNYEMFQSVATSILNCESEFKGAEAAMYNRFCEIAEQI
jgi:hypothetical protein